MDPRSERAGERKSDEARDRRGESEGERHPGVGGGLLQGGDEEKGGYGRGRGGEGSRLPSCVEFPRLKRDFQNNKLRGKWRESPSCGAEGGGGDLVATRRRATKGFVAGWLRYFVDSVDVRLVMSRQDALEGHWTRVS